jgi:hypothetical protein
LIGFADLPDRFLPKSMTLVLRLPVRKKSAKINKNYTYYCQWFGHIIDTLYMYN